jgi:hypothetical protein
MKKGVSHLFGARWEKVEKGVSHLFGPERRIMNNE